MTQEKQGNRDAPAGGRRIRIGNLLAYILILLVIKPIASASEKFLNKDCEEIDFLFKRSRKAFTVIQAANVIGLPVNVVERNIHLLVKLGKLKPEQIETGEIEYYWTGKRIG